MARRALFGAVPGPAFGRHPQGWLGRADGWSRLTVEQLGPGQTLGWVRSVDGH